VIAGLVGNGAFRQLPYSFGDIAVRLVGDDHVGRQTVREGADLARGAAGRRLAGQRERAVAGLGDFSGQQMNVVDEIVAPDATRVLVEAHGPEAGDLGLRIGIKFGQSLDLVRRHAGNLRRLLDRVFGNERGVFVERHIGRVIGLGGAFGGLLQGMFGTKAVADIGLAAPERGVLGDEVLVDAARLDDVVGDGVEDCQIGLRFEDDAKVGEVEGTVLEGRHHRDADMRIAQAPVGDARPQQRMHLRHVRAPQHKGVGSFDIVIAAHRLVDAEGAHEARDRRRHPVARIGIDIVAAEAGLEQLGRGIALSDRPLAGAEHADAARTALLQCILELDRHDVESFVP